MNKTICYILLPMCIVVILSVSMAVGQVSNGTDDKAPKALKEGSVDLKTDLPQTLDPDLFKGKAKAAYTVAKEIPEVLAQMPCLCGCEVYGHKNLLDCFVDKHGAG
jgi:hypothetical protein